MNKILDLTKECYSSIEKAEALVGILQEKYQTEKCTDIILEMILTNIKELANLIFEIQDAAK